MVRLRDYCETDNLLPEEQRGSHPTRSIMDTMFVIRRLQELGRTAGGGVRCFVDLQEAYDTVDRALLWQALTHIGVPLLIEIIVVSRQLNDGIRACVRGQTAGERSEWFQVGQGLRQGCVSLPLLCRSILCYMSLPYNVLVRGCPKPS